MTTRRGLSGRADPAEAIKAIYLRAKPATIERDLKAAIAWLKQLPDEDARQRVAVFMDGLSQMRSEWRATTAERSGRSSVAAGPTSPSARVRR